MLEPQVLTKKGEKFVSNYIVEEDGVPINGRLPTNKEFEQQVMKWLAHAKTVRFDYRELVYNGRIVTADEFATLSGGKGTPVAVYYKTT